MTSQIKCIFILFIRLEISNLARATCFLGRPILPCIVPIIKIQWDERSSRESMHFCMGAQPSREATSCRLNCAFLENREKVLLRSPFRFFYPEEGVEKNVDPFTTTYARLGSIESMCGDEFTNVLGALKNKMRKKERPARFVKGVFQTVKLTWRCPHRPTGCIRAKTDLRAVLCWP